MYIPLQLRLTLFYTLVLGLALWFFGYTVYIQAEQRAYKDLDDTLRSRAASVRLSKDLFIAESNSGKLPFTLSSVDALGTGGVAIEVLDNRMILLATTDNPDAGNSFQTGISGLGTSPIPWDAQAARWTLQHPYSKDGNPNSIYSTIIYQGQHVRVYTMINNDLG